MTYFIESDKGYVALSTVGRLSNLMDKERQKWEIYDRDGDRLGVAQNVEETVVQMLPVAEPWELLVVILGDVPEVVSEPVIAWAVTLGGRIKPVSVGFPDATEVHNPKALRRRFSDVVYEIGINVHQFANEADWLASLVKFGVDL